MELPKLKNFFVSTRTKFMSAFDAIAEHKDIIRYPIDKIGYKNNKIGLKQPEQL